jgi:AcrR family transcriptional regulator
MATVDRPLRRDAERNRRRILEAAREVFAERGLGASLDDIARHAEVGVGTVYRRFPDKQVLVEALFEESLTAIVQILESGLENEDAWDGLATSLERAFERQAADRGLMQVLFSDEHGGSRVAVGRDHIAPLAERLLRRAQEQGAARADADPSDLKLINLMLGALVDATREIEPDVWRRYLAIVLDGLRTSRAAPTPLPAAPLILAEAEAAMRCWRPSPPGR